MAVRSKCMLIPANTSLQDHTFVCQQSVVLLKRSTKEADRGFDDKILPDAKR